MNLNQLVARIEASGLVPNTENLKQRIINLHALADAGVLINANIRDIMDRLLNPPKMSYEDQVNETVEGLQDEDLEAYFKDMCNCLQNDL